MDPLLGQIIMFGGNFAPRGWALCNGQLLPISQNTALFSILGTIYGGDGRTTFGLPDLRGRAPIHSGNASPGPGLSSYPEGAKGGAESRQIIEANLPAHTHSFDIKTSTAAASESEPLTGEGFALGAASIYSDQSQDGFIAGGVTASSGANQSVDIRSPYLAINFIIATQGTFPSRD